MWSAFSGVAQFATSVSGTLVYVPGGIETGDRSLVWVDRQGVSEPLPAPSREYLTPRISPDGRRIAVGIREDEFDIWVYDIPRMALTRLTFEGGTTHPAWSPDGKKLAFLSDRDGPPNIFWQMADGSGGVERLTTHDYQTAPASFSPDGQLLAFNEGNPETGRDIRVLNLGDRQAETFLQTRYQEGAPRFSPDGKWMAYVSDESGRGQVYVRQFPQGDTKWQISGTGGAEPRWAPSGRELFYRNGANEMVAAEVLSDSTWVPGEQQVLFPWGSLDNDRWVVAPGDERFLFVRLRDVVGVGELIVVENFFEELKAKVGN